MSDLVERIGTAILDRIMSRLKRIEPGSKYVRVSRFLAYAAAAILVTDLHKYGSWYMGNSTYWQPWAYIVMPLLLLPGISCVMAYYVRRGYTRLIRAIIAGTLTSLFVMSILIKNLLVKHFPDPGYLGGWIRSDGFFWFAIGYAFILWGLLVGAYVYLCSPRQ